MSAGRAAANDSLTAHNFAIFWLFAKGLLHRYSGSTVRRAATIRGRRAPV